MNTLNQIKEELVEYAESSNLTGTVVEALCSLLAYSIYKNQMVQTKVALDASFVTSTALSARVHHAGNLLYSVPRGSCPYITITYLLAIETNAVVKLDYCSLYNGYYLYYKDDYTYSQGDSIESISLIVAANKLQTVVVGAPSQTLYFIDFYDENISEDLVLYEIDSEGTYTRAEITSDSNSFYQTTGEGDNEYLYDYLIVTLPGYGVRVMRHSDSAGWGAPSYELRYIPYSETLPDFSSLKSIPGVNFLFENDGTMETTITITGYDARQEDLETIYSRAVDAWHAQGTVATVTDLKALLNTLDSNAAFSVLVDRELSISDSGEYSLIQNPLVATVVYSMSTLNAQDFEERLDIWAMSLSVTRDIQIFAAVAKASTPGTLYVRATSESLTLTNQTLASLATSYQAMIGEELDHSQIEADIVRMGYDTVKLFTDAEMTTEWTGSVEVEEWEYPEISLVVGG